MSDDWQCPPPDERINFQKSWSCDEVHSFRKVEIFYILDGYILKSAQTLVFVSLILVLVYRRMKGTGEIAKLSILIALLALFDGVFAIMRIMALFPLFTRDESFETFLIADCLTNISYFGAIWFFGIKYYETAEDLQLMIEEST